MNSPGSARLHAVYGVRSLVLNPAVPLLLAAVTVSGSPGQTPGTIAHWLNVEAFRLLAHHTSAVIAAVILFWFVGWLIRKLLHDSAMKRAVLLLDEVVLLCIFAYFAYELLFLLYLRTQGVAPS